MKTYEIQKISKFPYVQASETIECKLEDGVFSDSRKLGKALRDASIIAKGTRLKPFISEGDKVLCTADRGPWEYIAVKLVG